jgi:rubredoxin
MQEVLMRQIPAKCGNCGYLFPSGYGFDPGETGIEATMSGWENAPVSTRCPMCGRKKGQILSGEYNFVKDTITLLSGPERTKEDLERLATFLRESQKQGATAEEIQEKAEKDTPELSTLIRYLVAERPTRIELATWLQVILTIINLLVASSDSVKNPEPSQVIYEVNNYNITVQNPPAAGKEQYVVSKVGRNDPCPCGSGKKFKKCCGGPNITQAQP